MRSSVLTWLTIILFFLLSCQNNHMDIRKQFAQFKSEETEHYRIAYAYATYLSTSRSIEAEEAASLILELISLGYYTEARYCVDNLLRNGIHSWDLIALRGLCYFNELQPGLARRDLERAQTGDPDNAKIKTLLDQINGNTNPVAEVSDLLLSAESLIVQKHYTASDSALYFMTFAKSLENLEEYGQYKDWIEKVLGGEDIIATHPTSFAGYIQKSKGLASMSLFDAAQRTLTRGLEKIPDNTNLILAKALVWVQAGQKETARQYLKELEQRGMTIDPSLKQQILQHHQ